MGRDLDTTDIARAMIACFGNQALQVMQCRVAANSQDGDIRMAQFWWRVALIVREMRADLASD
jgi:hypothetical protein